MDSDATEPSNGNGHADDVFQAEIEPLMKRLVAAAVTHGVNLTVMAVCRLGPKNIGMHCAGNLTKAGHGYELMRDQVRDIHRFQEEANPIQTLGIERDGE